MQITYKDYKNGVLLETITQSKVLLLVIDFESNSHCNISLFYDDCF